MSFVRLPNEALFQMIRYLDLRSLYRFGLTSKRMNAVVEYVFYSRAAALDESNYGWPVSLFMAALWDRMHSFKHLLAETSQSMQMRPMDFMKHRFLENAWRTGLYEGLLNDMNLQPLLHLLCKFNLEEMATLLLKEPNGSEYRDLGKALQLSAEVGNVNLIKRLIDAGAPPYEEDYADHPHSALTLAMQNGHMAAVEYLIDAGANVQPSYLLFQAALTKNTHIVRRLVAAGAGPGANGGHAVIYALSSCNGCVDELRQLVERGAPIRSANLDGAVHAGDIDMVRYLLDNGVTFREPLHHGLCSVAMAKFVLDVAPHLVNSGRTDYNRKRLYFPVTPLDTVYTNDSESSADLALYFIQAGGTVNRENPATREITLLTAARRGDAEVVSALLDLDSQRKLLSSTGKDNRASILRYVAGLRTSSPSTLNAAKLVRVVLDSESDSPVDNEDHDTALHIAAMEADLEAVDELLRAGLDPGALNEDEYTPLHLAVRYGFVENLDEPEYADMARRIILGHENIRTAEDMGVDISRFMHTGHMAIIQRLVDDSRVNISMRDMQGRTVLDIIAQYEGLPKDEYKI